MYVNTYISIYMYDRERERDRGEGGRKCPMLVSYTMHTFAAGGGGVSTFFAHKAANCIAAMRSEGV